MAFQLTHRWSQEKILREYLNTIYFGNGAYGIESAARVYFGWAQGYDPQPRTWLRTPAATRPRASAPQGVRVGADARSGGAARRDGRQPDASSTRLVHTRARAASTPQPGAAATCSTRATSSYGQYQYALSRPAADACRDRAAAAAALGGAVLHQLGRAPDGAALEHEGLSPKEAQYGPTTAI